MRGADTCTPSTPAATRFAELAAAFRAALQQQEHARAKDLLEQLIGAPSTAAALTELRDLIAWALLATRAARSHLACELIAVSRERMYGSRAAADAATVVNVAG
jgi:hypothetical protein